MRDRNRSCPAVSHSCSRTVRSSRYMVFDKKSIPIVAWYVLSKVSYINRVIKLVFPTLCSPRNTNLNFLSGVLAEEKSAVEGVWGVDMLYLAVENDRSSEEVVCFNRAST